MKSLLSELGEGTGGDSRGLLSFLPSRHDPTPVVTAVITLLVFAGVLVGLAYRIFARIGKPNRWIFDRGSLIHTMRPVLKLFNPKKAEIHYRVSLPNIAGDKNRRRKFVRKHLVGMGYTSEEAVSYYDECFGRTFFHLKIEKR